jgi:Tfp pilus assembly protein PilF
VRVAFAAVFAIALGGCGESGVVRVVDERPQEGRFISEAAYALFARGAEAEMAGDLGAARRMFELAAGEDPHSPEIWTRLGALLCREEPTKAAAAFARAQATDASFGPLYRERARCLVAGGEAPAAIADAERALALDPDDLDTALVRAEALALAGRVDEARRALRAAAVRRPAFVEPWAALLSLARRTGDTALAREAALHVASLSPGTSVARWGTPPNPRSPALLAELAPLSDLDAALGAGDLAGAQRLALELRMPGAEVALRAAALGLASLAREQAALLLGADPRDASARIALVAAADLQGDMPALAAALRAIPQRSTAPSRLARLLLAEVLHRRAGDEAARAWLGAAAAPGVSGQSPRREPAPPVDSDPLLAATEKRVRAELSAP